MATDKTKRPPKLRSIASAAPVDADQFQLTRDEMRLIRAYRQISDKHQKVYKDAIEGCAQDVECRRPSKNPGLRLIAGGAA
jgi:hypothetical protein